MIGLLLAVMLTSAQLPLKQPVTIEVTQDVLVTNTPERGGGQRRGRLYVGRDREPLVIHKGHTFEMRHVDPEGGCRIRFENREYSLASCPWREGFRDRQADIFKVRSSQ